MTIGDEGWQVSRNLHKCPEHVTSVLVQVFLVQDTCIEQNAAVFGAFSGTSSCVKFIMVKGPVELLMELRLGAIRGVTAIWDHTVLPAVLGSETAVLWQDRSQTGLGLGLGLILLVVFPTLLCTTRRRRCVTWYSTLFTIHDGRKDNQSVKTRQHNNTDDDSAEM